MLNEREEYQMLLSPGYQHLFYDPNLWKQSLSGLSHAFVILARGMNEKLRDCQVDPNRWYRCMVAFLSVWFCGGGCPDDLKPYPDIAEDFRRADASNLKRYILCMDSNKIHKLLDKKSADPDMDDVERVDKYFADKLSGFQNSLFSKAKGQKSNKNQVFFSSVIADALHLGPLKNEKLLVKADPKTWKKNDFGLMLRGKENTLGGTTTDQRKKLLVIVAYYLRNQYAGQAYAPLCKVDISNYLQIRSDAKGGGALGGVADFINYNRFWYQKKTPLIVYNSLNGKAMVDAGWLRDFDVRLVDADAEVPQEYVALTDTDLQR